MMNAARQLKTLLARAGLSQLGLARLLGKATGSSVQHHFDERRRGSRGIDPGFLSRIAPFIVGRGDPPVTAAELLALSTPGTKVSLSSVAVVAIPVVQWGTLNAGAEMLKSAKRVETIHMPGIATGAAHALIAAQVLDAHAERVAAPGAFVIIDLDDTSLVDGARYIILLQGEAVIRRFGLRPLRWESEAAHNEPAIYFSDPGGAEVQVVGRVIRSFKEW
jgi:hypothetical protein